MNIKHGLAHACKDSPFSNNDCSFAQYYRQQTAYHSYTGIAYVTKSSATLLGTTL